MRIQNSLILSAFIAGSCFFLSACSKDQYTTKPQLKFLKAKSYDVPYGGLIEMTMEFTDKEGDLSDSLFIESVVRTCAGSNRVLKYKIPTFPETSDIKGEFTITFENGTQNTQYPVHTTGPNCPLPDTTTFRFWLKDKAQNISDTISTDQPIIIRKS